MPARLRQLRKKELYFKKMIVKEEQKAKALGSSLTQEAKPLYFNAKGLSMCPFIKNGDCIKVVPINKEKLFLTHRVVKIIEQDGKTAYFTKGDAHKGGLENPVNSESIVGRVTEIRRGKISFDLNLPLWRRFNRFIAQLSLRYPKALSFLSKYISLAIEWRLFLFKLKNRLKKANPLLYNTEELLLICCQKNLDEKLKKEAASLIKEGLYWQRFLELAMKKGVTILVYDALREIAPRRDIPQFVFDRLKFSYLFIISEVNYQHKQLEELLGVFTKKGILVLPLKGTILAKRLYGNIAGRGISCDFDFLIKEEDREITKNALEGVGYRFSRAELVEKWQWQYEFSKSKEKKVDLHWDITMMVRSRERIEGLWEGTEPVEREGASYYDFKPEELLLYLSAHLVNSNSFRTLRAVADINRLLQKYAPEINWQRLADKAKKWRLSGSLYAALRLNQDFFVPRFPGELLAWLGLSSPKRIFIRAFANKNVILKEGLRRAFLDKFLAYIFFEITEARCLKDYLIILKKVVFPPRQAMGQRSYILRIFKGIAKLVLPKPA